MYPLIFAGLLTMNIATPHLAQVDPVNAIRIYENARRELREVKQEREEYLMQAKEQVQTRVEAHREQIAQMTNERLRNQLTEMSDRFEFISDKWTSHWTDVLNRLDSILAKIEARSTELAESGVDTSSLDSAIAAASTSIEAAVTSVQDLASKEYIYGIDDEATVGENVRATIDVLKSDMEAVRSDVTAARESVQEAFSQLRVLITENE